MRKAPEHCYASRRDLKEKCFCLVGKKEKTMVSIQSLHWASQRVFEVTFLVECYWPHICWNMSITFWSKLCQEGSQGKRGPAQVREALLTNAEWPCSKWLCFADSGLLNDRTRNTLICHMWWAKHVKREHIPQPQPRWTEKGNAWQTPLLSGEWQDVTPGEESTLIRLEPKCYSYF